MKRRAKILTKRSSASRLGSEAFDKIERLQKVIFELFPFQAVDGEFEGVSEKIVQAGIFIQTADEVTDGVDELLSFDSRCVKQQVLGQLKQGAPLVICHSLEHFELDFVQHIVFLCPYDAVRKVKKIMGGES